MVPSFFGPFAFLFTYGMWPSTTPTTSLRSTRNRGLRSLGGGCPKPVLPEKPEKPCQPKGAFCRCCLHNWPDASAAQIIRGFVPEPQESRDTRLLINESILLSRRGELATRQHR
jgi:hypothetical protein